MEFCTTKREACNYACKPCRKTNKIPNILGKFVIQDNGSVLCTGCNQVFAKENVSIFVGALLCFYIYIKYGKTWTN